MTDQEYQEAERQHYERMGDDYSEVEKCPDDVIIELYQKGFSLTKIAKIFSSSSATIWRILKFNKIMLRTISETNSNEKNGQWKGDNVSYKELHSWVKRHKLKPLFCESCKVKPPYDLANISQEYKRDINDFEWLCRKCHMEKDGRLLRLNQFQTDSYDRDICPDCGSVQLGHFPNHETHELVIICRECGLTEIEKI